MPKLKTHKGAKRRIHITGTGKLMRMKGPKSHLRRKKAARVRRLFDKNLPISKTDEAKLRRVLPYSMK